MTRNRWVLVVLLIATVVTGPSAAHAEGNEAPGAPVGARSITAGDSNTCALLTDHTAACWGQSGNGQLGDGNGLNQGDDPGEMGAARPVIDLGANRTATSITAGAAHACAIVDHALVKCWGSNGFGQLGLGDTANRGDAPGEMGDALPAVDLGTGRTATAIAAGQLHTCALLDDGTVKCWGQNFFGQLGLGDSAHRGDAAGEMGDSLPTVPLGTGRTATAIGAGDLHTCALLDDGTVKCWGSGNSGQLGQGNAGMRGDNPGELGDAMAPIALGTGRTATAIAVGSSHTCALLDDASVKCWGVNGAGQLGRGDTNARGDGPGEMGDSLAAIALGTGRTATGIATGSEQTCALLDDGTVKCWGQNNNGQLGQGDTADRGDQPGELGDALTAVNLGPGRTATAVTAGAHHSCALLDDGTMKCWGGSLLGQLGQGTSSSLGDNVSEMAALDPIDLRALVGRTTVAVTLTGTPAAVVAGDDIDYTITVTNTGSTPLSSVRIEAPDVEDCESTIGGLSVGASAVRSCAHTATDDDVPVMTNQVLVTTAQGAFDLSGTRRTRVAAAVHRPDAQLRLGAGPFIGNGVYNPTGASQARSTTVPANGTATFTVRVQNDGNVQDDLTVLGQGTTSRYTVTYKDGPTNVTAAVLAGTYAIDDLGPGSTHDLTVTIKAKAGTPVNNLIGRLVTVTSAGDTTKKDAVKATVRRR